jgi:hypothetical protein
VSGTPPDPTTPKPSWLVLILGSFVLAFASLFVLPRAVAYDPWSWLVWGREIAHLSLNTRNGATAVKPLPIFIDTLLAPTGSLAPVLWLMIARAATLASLALAFRLGRQLGGVGAGLVSAVGLAVSNQFLGYLLVQGMSEPMAAATVLAAVDCHLLSRRRWAYGCLILAGLLRPEAWPVLILYSLWLAYLRLNWQRVLAVVIAVAVPPSWFVIDWFGARQFFRSANAATHESQGGPLLTREPGLATFRETWHLVSGPVLVLFLLGVITSVVLWLRGGRRERLSPTVWLGLGAFGWLVLDAALAQGRFATGAPRYLLPGVALACVVAGVFVVDVVRALARLRPDSFGLRAATALMVVVLGLLITSRVITTGQQIHKGITGGNEMVAIKGHLQQAIAKTGGRSAVLGCGPTIITQAYQVTLLAWELNIPIADVRIVPRPSGIVLQQAAAPRIPAAISANYHKVAIAGSGITRWGVLTTCPSL